MNVKNILLIILTAFTSMHAMDNQDNQKAIGECTRSIRQQAKEGSIPELLTAIAQLRILTKNRNKTDYQTLYTLLAHFPDMSLTEVTSYYKAFYILKQRSLLANQAYQKISRPKFQKDQKEKREIPKAVQDCVREMLYPHLNTQDPKLMPFALKKAILKSTATDPQLDSRIQEYAQQGYDFSLKTKDGMDALELAAYHAKYTALHHMIRNSRYISPEKIKILHELAQKSPACEADKKQTADCINAIAAYQKEKTEQLQTALRNGNTGMIWEKLQQGANPNHLLHDGTPLVGEAFTRDRVACLALMLKQGANPNTKWQRAGRQETLMTYAIILNRTEHFKLLLEHGADPNSLDQKCRPLAWQAMNENNPTCLSLLLKHGANPNTKWQIADREDSLMTEAIFWNKTEHLKLLLEHGADPNAKVVRGDEEISLLEEAISWNKEELAKLLLEHGADKNEPILAGKSSFLGNFYMSPLAYAQSWNTKEKIVEILKKHNAQAYGSPFHIYSIALLSCGISLYVFNFLIDKFTLDNTIITSKNAHAQIPLATAICATGAATCFTSLAVFNRLYNKWAFPNLPKS